MDTNKPEITRASLGPTVLMFPILDLQTMYFEMKFYDFQIQYG